MISLCWYSASRAPKSFGGWSAFIFATFIIHHRGLLFHGISCYRRNAAIMYRRQSGRNLRVHCPYEWPCVQPTALITPKILFWFENLTWRTISTVSQTSSCTKIYYPIIHATHRRQIIQDRIWTYDSISNFRDFLSNWKTISHLNDWIALVSLTLISRTIIILLVKILDFEFHRK